MAEPTQIGRYIPLPRGQLFELLQEEGRLEGEQSDKFKVLCVMLQSLYHYEFHETLEKMKHAYRLFNPDAEELAASTENREKREVELMDGLVAVLEKGNFEEIGKERLEVALAGEGLFPISLDVPFDDMELYRLFYQGESRGSAEVKGPIPLMKRRVEFDVYDRVVLLVKMKGAEHFEQKGSSTKGSLPGKIYLKYLKGVPKPDLEMVFPNPKPRMKTMHLIKIGVPVLVGVGITLHKLVLAPFVLGTGKNPLSEGLSIGLVAILGGLAGYVFKAYTGYRNTVQDFLAEITTSLYFKNLVSNQGVFTTLVDDAEEEETKEAVLAYFFLLTSPKALSGEQLDGEVERWLEKQLGRRIDFELDDALGKLERLGLLAREGDDGLRVIGLDDALKKLDREWDDIFQYNV